MGEKHLIIFGEGATADEIYEHISENNNSEFSNVEKVYINEEIFSNDALKRIQNSKDIGGYYIFGLTEFRYRLVAIRQIEKYGENLTPYTFIHETAFVSPSAVIGLGSYIAPMAVVSTKAVIGVHGHINLGASIGHHSEIGAHSVVLPGSRISGNVKLGERCLVGSNSVVFQGISIGVDNVIDALTYVKKDTQPNMISYGIPGKSIRRVIG